MIPCLCLLEIGVRFALRIHSLQQKSLSPEPPINEALQRALLDLASSTNSYIIFDRELGWSIRPDSRKGLNGNAYSSNRAGIRGTREYDLRPPEGVTRIAAFGPSFTHCDEVNDEETWQALMEEANPALEVMNWGVGAYGTDQAYLRYKLHGKAYRPHIVLIGYEEDNYLRNLNRFHPFYIRQGLPLAKPMFVENDVGLELLESPFTSAEQLIDILINDSNRFLDMIDEDDEFYEPLRYRHTRADASYLFRLARTMLVGSLPTPAERIRANRARFEKRTLRILQTFVEEVQSSGAIPIVIFFPMTKKSLLAHHEGQSPIYADLRDRLAADGTEVVDLMPILCERAGSNASFIDSLFAGPDGRGHYSPTANRIVSEAVLRKVHEVAATTLQAK